MRGKTLIFLLLVATAARADDFGWLEGEWVSDADATMAENAQFAKMTDATREKFKSLYGRLRWRFDGGSFEAIQPDSESDPISYSVTDVGGGRGELRLYERGSATLYEIRRTSTGFCAELKIDMEPARPFPDESLRSECFKPADD